MPLRWKIAPLEHMVVCEFVGVVTLNDIIEYFAEIERAGAMSYRKILDATRGECGLSGAELGRLAAQAGSTGRRGTPGPIAVVTGSSRNDKVVTNLRTLASIDRRLWMFPTIHDARWWLARQPLGTPSRDPRPPT